jgi:hypothetical protein
MSQRLFAKYFPIAEEQESDELRNRALDLREKLAALVASAGWSSFKARVESIVEEAMDIKPGDEAAMLYQIGKKDGLMALRTLMNQIEREIVFGRE